MGAAATIRRFSRHDYWAIEDRSPVRHEFLHGVILAMVPGMAVASLLGACRPRVPLAQAPIFDAPTEDHLTEARAELTAFDGWIGKARLAIVEVRFEDAAKVRFEDDVESWKGAYRSNGVVMLSQDLTVDEVRLVLRHELCHALDFSEDLTEAYRTDLLVPAEILADGRETDDRMVAEAFALLCEVGPVPSAMLGFSCDDSASAVAPSYSMMNEHVWTGDPPLDVRVVEPQSGAWLEPEVEPELVRGLADVAGIEVVYDSELGIHAVQLDLLGREIEPGAARPQASELTVEDAPDLLGCDPVRLAGWSAGPAVLECETGVSGFGTELHRYAAWDGARWSALDGGCAAAATFPEPLVLTGGRIWVVSDTVSGVRWDLLADDPLR